MSSPHPHGPAPITVDVAIIGGGIAGSALAITLRRLGMDVVLVEREAAFRDRIRGEAMHPWGVREVDALGLRPLFDEAGATALPFWTRYRDAEPGEPYAWESDVPGSPPELGYNHPRLQETLIRAAGEEGARVFRPASASVSRSGTGWTLSIESNGDTRAVGARLLVGADGKNSSTRKLIGAQAVRDPVHHQMGGLLLTGVDLPRDSVHQAYFDGGIAVIFPQGDDVARSYYIAQGEITRTLAGKGAIPEYIRRVASCFPDGAFARAEPAGPMGFFPNADLVVDRIAGENAVLVGDAAGANDPTQGQGTSLLFRDIRVLRDAMTEDVQTAPEALAARRRADFPIVRAYAAWVAVLLTRTGVEADALRDQVSRARESDPLAEGYAPIYALGPIDQPTGDHARRRFYGEHLDDARIRSEVVDGSIVLTAAREADG